MSRSRPRRPATAVPEPPDRGAVDTPGGHLWPLLALLAAALAVKLVVLLQLADHPLLQPQGELDTSTYVTLARQVANGGPLAVREAFALSPLYVFFLATVFAAGGTLFTAKVIQVVLGTAAIALLFATTQRWFGRPAAWAAAGLAAATGLFTFYEVLILQAALDAFLVAATLYLVTRAVTEVRMAWALAAGIALGCLALNRPNAVIYGAAVAAWLAWRAPAVIRPGHATGAARAMRALLFVTGVALVLLPNAWRNHAVSGDAVLISSHGGLNLYIGNNPGATGTYQPIPDITPSMTGQIRDATVVAERAAGRRLTPGEVSDHFVSEALGWIAAHPVEALRLTGRKAMLFLNHENVPLNYSYAYFSRDEPTLLRGLIVGPWLLIPLGLAGLVRAVRRDPAPGFWAWAMFVPVYAVSVVAFFVSSRYRMPWLLPLCTTAGAALVGTAEAVRRGAWGREGVTLAVAGGVAILCLWPMAIDDRRAEERTRMVMWLAEQGRDADAVRLADEVAAAHPRPAMLRARLGDTLAGQERFDAAIDQYRRALALDDGQPAVHFALGQALVVVRRPAEAIPHLSRAADAGYRTGTTAVWLVRALAQAGDVGRAGQVLAAVPAAVVGADADVAFDLGTMALELGDAPRGAQALASAVERDPTRADAREQLGVAWLMLDRPTEAVAALEEACRLAPSRASAQLNLAVAYATVGRTADARRAAQKSYDLDPTEPRAAALLESLPK